MEKHDCTTFALVAIAPVTYPNANPNPNATQNQEPDHNPEPNAQRWHRYYPKFPELYSRRINLLITVLKYLTDH